MTSRNVKSVCAAVAAASLLLLSTPAFAAEFTAQTAYEFLAAQAEVYKKGNAESVERFVSFLADDVQDIHVAYGREFTGKEHFRKNMPNKAKALISYEREVMQVVMGTQVAIVIYREETSEKKADGRINDYRGRTIAVLDFNDEGLITTIRRYQD